jgi:hypothetical protein
MDTPTTGFALRRIFLPFNSIHGPDGSNVCSSHAGAGGVFLNQRFHMLP